MRIFKNVIIVMFLLFFITPGSFAAQLSQGTQYGMVKLGYFMPNGDDEGLGGYDNDFNFGAGYGRFFADNISVEIGLEYHSVEGKESYPTRLVYGGNDYNGFVDYDGTIALTIIPITAKYHFPVSNELTAFVGAGIGWYMISLDWDVTYRIPNVASEAQSSISDDGSSIGFHLVGGAEYAINSNISIGAELKWDKATNEVTPDSDLKIDKDLGGITFNVVGKILF